MSYTTREILNEMVMDHDMFRLEAFEILHSNVEYGRWIFRGEEPFKHEDLVFLAKITKLPLYFWEIVDADSSVHVAKAAV